MKSTKDENTGLLVSWNIFVCHNLVYIHFEESKPAKIASKLLSVTGTMTSY